uniref:RING-type E3 ubiquitin transferase n=1 Tax=Populus trichocarpa TaxID=3694 RepID=A9PCV2_POPTR|nr:unknown [Populus trichocarpa]
MKLQKANEELGSMFPLFNEFSGSGNALERVLALEIELAEALQAKKRSSILFQSSFFKQHSDEEAVFKSFRDINELIKDMLELKGRYTTVETQLKEMHDRYSQLSLQFAEVEGERQKLTMTLKNVRASKKALCLNRSSSASLGDHSS